MRLVEILRCAAEFMICSLLETCVLEVGCFKEGKKVTYHDESFIIYLYGLVCLLIACLIIRSLRLIASANDWQRALTVSTNRFIV